jgi:hypothetical protein
MTIAVDVLSRTSVSPDAWAMHSNPMLSLNNNKDKTMGKSLSKEILGKGSKSTWSGWGLID